MNPFTPKKTSKTNNRREIVAKPEEPSLDNPGRLSLRNRRALKTEEAVPVPTTTGDPNVPDPEQTEDSEMSAEPARRGRGKGKAVKAFEPAGGSAE